MSKPIDFDYIEKLLAEKARRGELYSPEEAELRFSGILKRMTGVSLTPEETAALAASAIEARSDATPQSGATEGESAAPKEDAHD